MKRLLPFLLGMLLMGCKIDQPSIRELHIDGGIFDIEVKVFITEDTALARQKVMKYYECETSDFDGRGVTFPTEDGQPVIMWFPNVDDHAIVVHELLHATKSIMNWAGLRLSDDGTEEVFCYEQQYLYNKIYPQ